MKHVGRERSQTRFRPLTFNQTKQNINKFKPALTSAQFRKLSKPQQRVAIARDAIAQIKLNRFLVRTGTWARIVGDDSDQEQAGLILNQNRLLGAPIVLPPPQCDCCALGACLLSSMRLANVLVLEDGEASTSQTFDQLEKWFSEDQLDLIECTFECEGREDDGQSINNRLDPDDFRKAIAFGKRHDDDEKRALAIFQNIIKHKGTFKP